MFALMRSQLTSIGFKQRICMFAILATFCLLMFIKEYLRVDFTSIRSVHNTFSGRSARSNFDWEGWVRRNKFKSIGDVYDVCGLYNNSLHTVA